MGVACHEKHARIPLHPFQGLVQETECLLAHAKRGILLRNRRGLESGLRIYRVRLSLQDHGLIQSPVLENHQVAQCVIILGHFRLQLDRPLELCDRLIRTLHVP